MRSGRASARLSGHSVRGCPSRSGDKLERGGEVEVSEFSCGEFGVEEVSALDRALEAALWCPLRRHRGAPLGFGFAESASRRL